MSWLGNNYFIVFFTENILTHFLLILIIYSELPF